MATTFIRSEPAVERDADALREEIGRLQLAIDSLSDALVEANRTRITAEEGLAHQRTLLEQALDLRAALEFRLVELEAEVLRERLTAEIRARLLADLGAAPWWRRNAAVRRALRLEGLLQRIRSGARSLAA
jgi:chromosome segregation ATPase